jgi:hypothetical protein
VTDSKKSPEENAKDRVRAEKERQREEGKKILWNSRVALIKKGQTYIQNNLYGEAAVTYEKYLKILEIIYECGHNGLTPEMLKESGRTNELSIIAGIYWDLVRIYDSNVAYLPRQKRAAEKLAKFALFTPLFHDIIKKANQFAKTAKQPEVIKIFVTSASKQKPRCFIATSAFESPSAVEVQQLRYYRDENLRHSSIGRQIIYYYYKYSPLTAKILDFVSFLKPPVRFFIRLIIKLVT